MGFGIGVVIMVSFFLSVDLDHAKKVRPPGAPPSGNHGSTTHGRLMRRVRRVTAQDGDMRIKPWVMRLYYHDALIYRRLKAGKGTAADCEAALVYFQATELQARRLSQKRGDTVLSAFLSGELTGERGEEGAIDQPRVSEGGDALAQSEVAAEVQGYCPTYIYLRIAVVELDCAMRVLHLFIYGIVLLARYVQIKDDATGAFDCGQLVSYFASP